MGELADDIDALVRAWVEIGAVDDALRWAAAHEAPDERFAALVALVRALGAQRPELAARLRAMLPPIDAMAPAPARSTA